MEGPKDGYYSSLNTFDHDTALGDYAQPEVRPLIWQRGPEIDASGAAKRLLTEGQGSADLETFLGRVSLIAGESAYL